MVSIQLEFTKDDGEPVLKNQKFLLSMEFSVTKRWIHSYGTETVFDFKHRDTFFQILFVIFVFRRSSRKPSSRSVSSWNMCLMVHNYCQKILWSKQFLAWGSIGGLFLGFTGAWVVSLNMDVWYPHFSHALFTSHNERAVPWPFERAQTNSEVFRQLFDSCCPRLLSPVITSM